VFKALPDNPQDFLAALTLPYLTLPSGRMSPVDDIQHLGCLGGPISFPH